MVLLVGVVVGPGAQPASAREPVVADRKGPVTSLQLTNVDGAVVTPVAEDGRKATVLFFVMHECPVANLFAPEIGRLQAEYAARGVRSWVVYVEDDLPAAKAREHAREYGFKAGAVLDPSHALVKAAGATVSPEAAVLSPSGQVLYLGRIDDRVAAYGKRRVEPTRRDLRLALEAVLAGRKVPDARTRAVGCYIPDAAPVKR